MNDSPSKTIIKLRTEAAALDDRRRAQIENQKASIDRLVGKHLEIRSIVTNFTGSDTLRSANDGYIISLMEGMDEILAILDRPRDTGPASDAEGAPVGDPDQPHTFPQGQAASVVTRPSADANKE